ncbi:hypothetical protein DOTSEDRAFT_23049 [Dothistroma septosporum NZE10]|uniref:Uncharacterized protein n=1 Tax=Dothistroma septosporum (strain NZE10 / CBS 128990) TaxID=675120 RepID=N1PNE2_DOTSN|nr:hypothetical protein DOTSEDRAFT_23049 [Dothistroma septosporum NZE10]
MPASLHWPPSGFPIVHELEMANKAHALRIANAEVEEAEDKLQAVNFDIQVKQYESIVQRTQMDFDEAEHRLLQSGIVQAKKILSSLTLDIQSAVDDLTLKQSQKASGDAEHHLLGQDIQKSRYELRELKFDLQLAQSDLALTEASYRSAEALHEYLQSRIEGAELDLWTVRLDLQTAKSELAVDKKQKECDEVQLELKACEVEISEKKTQLVSKESEIVRGGMRVTEKEATTKEGQEHSQKRVNSARDERLQPSRTKATPEPKSATESPGCCKDVITDNVDDHLFPSLCMAFVGAALAVVVAIVKAVLVRVLPGKSAPLAWVLATLAVLISIGLCSEERKERQKIEDSAAREAKKEQDSRLPKQEQELDVQGCVRSSGALRSECYAPAKAVTTLVTGEAVMTDTVTCTGDDETSAMVIGVLVVLPVFLVSILLILLAEIVMDWGKDMLNAYVAFAERTKADVRRKLEEMDRDEIPWSEIGNKDDEDDESYWADVDDTEFDDDADDDDGGQSDWEYVTDDKDGLVDTIGDGISRTERTARFEALRKLQLNIEQAKGIHKQLANDILKARSELKSVRWKIRQAKHELDIALFSIEDTRNQLFRPTLLALRRNDEGENDWVTVDPEEVPQ